MLRKVKVKYWNEDEKGYKEEEGLFHQWGSNFIELREGVEGYSIAIVELSDGKVVEVTPSNIQFVL